MGIKQKKNQLKISQKVVSAREKCSADKETIVFSFRHMTTCDDYNFYCFDKHKKNSETSNAIATLTDKLSELSEMTWDEFFSKGRRNGGPDPIFVSQMDSKFINKINIPLSGDERLIAVRFNSQKSRFILKRGTKCGRVAHILGIDYNLTLYKH